MLSRVTRKGRHLEKNEFNAYMSVGVPALFVAEIGDARFGVASWHVGREVAVQELVVNGPAIWDGGGRLRVHGKDHETVDPLERVIIG